MTNLEGQRLAVLIAHDSSSRQPTCLDAQVQHKQYAATSSNISCSAEPVVGVNLPTRIHHLEREHRFERTKNGEFECEKVAKAEGNENMERVVTGYRRLISSSRLTPVTRRSAARVSSVGSRSARSYDP